jgi:hypothetical protein
MSNAQMVIRLFEVLAATGTLLGGPPITEPVRLERWSRT